MLSVATIHATTGATVPVLNTIASLGGAAAGPGPAIEPGSCLNWARADASDAEIVDCGQPHLFEQVAAVEVADPADITDDKRSRQVILEKCTPKVVNHLNGKYDPNGRFRVGGLKPRPGWADGDRSLRCGIQAYSRSGALYPIVGAVAGQDQSRVQPPGTCLGIDGLFIGDPIDCAKPHAVESVGSVDLAAKFKDVFPPAAEQDKYLQVECGRLGGEYPGGKDVIAKKKLVVYWDNLKEESWKAGSRKVACNFAALLRNPSGFAPVTGSVRDGVAVGDKQAPPAEQLVPPGAPAPELPPLPQLPAQAPAQPAAPTVPSVSPPKPRS